jgi:4-hydroxybenzoyl-CoA thioesterase
MSAMVADPAASGPTLSGPTLSGPTLSGLTRPRLEPVAASDLPAQVFRTPRKVRFSDCDPAGIAYTARLVDLMNGAVEDLFPARLGLSYYTAIVERRLGLGYGRVDCDFFQPAHMGDAVELSVLVQRLGQSSIAWQVHIHRGQDELARGLLVSVTTSLDTHKATPVPDWLRQAVEAYRRDCG